MSIPPINNTMVLPTNRQSTTMMPENTGRSFKEVKSSIFSNLSGGSLVNHLLTRLAEPRMPKIRDKLGEEEKDEQEEAAKKIENNDNQVEQKIEAQLENIEDLEDLDFNFEQGLALESLGMSIAMLNITEKILDISAIEKEIKNNFHDIA